MGPEELRAALGTLGLSRDILCEALEVDETRLDQWLDGTVPMTTGASLRFAVMGFEETVEIAVQHMPGRHAVCPIVVCDDDAHYMRLGIFPFALHAPIAQALRRRLQAQGVEVREVHLAGWELTEWCRSHNQPLSFQGFIAWHREMYERMLG
jgi:hypothetical protein